MTSSRLRSIVGSLLGACALSVPLACSDDPTPKAPEPPPPTGTTDVPVVKLEASTADCATAYQGTAPKAGLNQGYSVAGQERSFELLLPADTSTPRPLFVAFNGTGQDGAAFVLSSNLKTFTDRGFIVLAPSSAGNGSTWPVWDSLRSPGTENEANKDLEYFDSVVKCTAAHLPIDKNRIYIGGHSAGGIMANHVLQRRSQLLAGGIVASGVFSLTSPAPRATLDPLFAIVTWGGDNDRYSGSAGGGVSVGGFNFVTEASLASKFYDAEPNVGEIYCRGDDVGHAWLVSLNDWFIDRLLAHPKGRSGEGATDLAPPVPAGAKATCSAGTFDLPATVEVMCQPSSTDGCQQACQLVGDCGVENGTIGPILKAQITAIGFSGPSNENCGGCVTKCEKEATTASDAAALTCFKERQAAATCGPGIEGAMPLVSAVNECCKDRKDSPYCVSVCKEIITSTTAADFFPTCKELAAPPQ